jgi:pyruvate dehydrogenase E1 component alpha subunit
VENLTYRWRGHSKSDRNRYRTKEEIEEWMAGDPIQRFQKELIAHGILDEAGAGEIAESAERTVREGIEFAKASAAPDPADLAAHVYADSHAGV